MTKRPDKKTIEVALLSGGDTGASLDKKCSLRFFASKKTTYHVMEHVPDIDIVMSAHHSLGSAMIREDHIK